MSDSSDSVQVQVSHLFGYGRRSILDGRKPRPRRYQVVLQSLLDEMVQERGGVTALELELARRAATLIIETENLEFEWLQDGGGKLPANYSQHVNNLVRLLGRLGIVKPEYWTPKDKNKKKDTSAGMTLEEYVKTLKKAH